MTETRRTTITIELEEDHRGIRVRGLVNGHEGGSLNLPPMGSLKWEVVPLFKALLEGRRKYPAPLKPTQPTSANTAPAEAAAQEPGANARPRRTHQERLAAAVAFDARMRTFLLELEAEGRFLEPLNTRELTPLLEQAGLLSTGSDRKRDRERFRIVIRQVFEERLVMTGSTKARSYQVRGGAR